MGPLPTGPPPMGLLPMVRHIDVLEVGEEAVQDQITLQALLSMVAVLM